MSIVGILDTNFEDNVPAFVITSCGKNETKTFLRRKLRSLFYASRKCFHIVLNIFRCYLLTKHQRAKAVVYVERSDSDYWDNEEFECDCCVRVNNRFGLWRLLTRFHCSGSINAPLTVTFYSDHLDLLTITPNQFEIPANSDNKWLQEISFHGDKPGHVEVIANATPVGVVDDSNLFVRIVIAHSSAIILISLIVGWIYFAAWSISFYPQIWINFKRKSVVGLSFDFLALNLLGHTLYAIFNSSLYWNTYIEDEYFQRFPRGMNPVELNDVVFSIHASIITALTVSQCLIYEVNFFQLTLNLTLKNNPNPNILASRTASIDNRSKHHRSILHCDNC